MRIEFIFLISFSQSRFVVTYVFTRGQFWPSGIVVACVCVCVCLSVITRDPSRLGSPNLDQRCKRPWLRPLLFFGLIDFDLQGPIQHESQNFPHFELVRSITHHPFNLGLPNLDQRCKTPWLRSTITSGEYTAYGHRVSQTVEFGKE